VMDALLQCKVYAGFSGEPCGLLGGGGPVFADMTAQA
jgi:hypothetical protein